MEDEKIDWEKIHFRCTFCSKEFRGHEAEQWTDRCPFCGDNGLMCHFSEDVELKINWHELRILGIWAENWARKNKDHPEMAKTVYAIAKRIEKQFPNKVPVTLAGELIDLKMEFPSMETNIDLSGPPVAGEHN